MNYIIIHVSSTSWREETRHSLLDRVLSHIIKSKWVRSPIQYKITTKILSDEYLGLNLTTHNQLLSMIIEEVWCLHKHSHFQSNGICLWTASYLFVYSNIYLNQFSDLNIKSSYAYTTVLCLIQYVQVHSDLMENVFWGLIWLDLYVFFLFFFNSFYPFYFNARLLS